MSQTEVKIKCIDCASTIYQNIDKTSSENHIYCPNCHSIFPFIDTMAIPEEKQIVPKNDLDSNIDELTKLLDDTGILKGLKDRNINPKEIMDIISKAKQTEEENDVVEKNLQKAYDEIPETFIKSESIFLNGYINGNPISFLLDTGAESSILPIDVIEESGLTDILDKKCGGKLLGVGEDKIIGRVHYVEVVLECGVYPCSFTVCSNPNIPPILGIDMMFNLGISLDFKKKKIHFGSDCSIDFVTKSGIIQERKKKNEQFNTNTEDPIEEIIQKLSKNSIPLHGKLNESQASKEIVL